ncbi:NDR1/HIN1-like protein 10, partial [Mucuna pruriens]
MYQKQPELNGAYYGPSIPPAKSYHRPGRGSGCGCCCGCLFSLIFKLIMTVVIIVGIAALVFWLIVRPNVVKVHVTDATLTEFNYTGNTLNYNLALNITVRNPNKRLGIYYDYIEARALFQDVRFDSQFPSPFYQGHKTTNVLSPVFQGQQVLALNADQTTELNKENTTGVYEIDVKMYLRVRFKLGVFKSRRLKPKVSCDLRVPLKGTPTVFEITKCDWDR